MMPRFTARLASRLSALLVLALASNASVRPVGAQHRAASVTTNHASRADGDSTARLVRRLKLRVDVLAREYGDNDNLSAAARHQVGQELDRTVDELEREVSAMNDRVAHMMERPGAGLASMTNPHGTETLLRAMMSQGGNSGMMPRGWLGIVVTGAAREPWIEGGELFIRYVTYPEIVSVEPSSPAEHAGLLTGDTLLAYDGRDVRDSDISLTRLLKPNARVVVRVGRDGRMHDVPVTIADAPSRIQLRRDDMNGTMSLEQMPSMNVEAPRFPRAVSAPVRRGAPAVMIRPLAPMRLTAPRVLAGPVNPVRPPTPLPVSVAGVAGAEMGSITQEWGRLTGVSYGVLVMRVPSASLAAESGLRDADVIVKAGGQTVRTLPMLRDMVAAAWGNGERSLAIEFVRDRKTHAAELRW